LTDLQIFLICKYIHYPMMKRPVIALACTLCAAMASDEPSVAVVELAAPGAPARESNPKAVPAPAPRTTLWSIGDPTGEEQLYLELINRARANPAAEGIRFAALTDPAVLQAYSIFGVNLNMMKSEMAALAPTGPVAMNAQLLASARAHSSWMLANNRQDHVEFDGKSIWQRANAKGYSASDIAENIYYASKTTEYGHAGFEVDWGPGGSGGMLAGRGHRGIIHDYYWREVGIGIVNGTNGNAGPQVVTQDFAATANSTIPFVTGVAYYDINGNNFYDPGEGLGGLSVTVSGANFHAVTAASGGYAVPVPAIPAGGAAVARTVTFTGNGFLHSATAQCLPSNLSVKVDFRPDYTPAALNGPAAPVLATPNTYAVAAVRGASAHEWRYMRRVAAATDGANATTNITSTLGSPLSTAVKQEGAACYRLHHGSRRDEYIEYRSSRVAGTAPVMRYYSRFAYALTSQKAFVQVSIDNGQTWISLDPQSGSGGSGQSSFSQRTVSLAAVAGREFKLRFYYAIAGAQYSLGSGNGDGWYIDNVSFTDVLDTTGAVSATVPATNSVSFAPPASGEWLLASRPTIGGNPLAYGPSLAVNAVTAPPPPTFSDWATTQESAAGLPAGTLSANAAGDYNKDGVPNLVAYALGLSPTQYAGHQLPLPAKQGSNLVLDYAREGSRSDVTVTPQVSSDFQTWYSPGQPGAPAGFTETLTGTLGTLQSRRAQLPISSGARWVMRLKVTRP
jgi:hypothetical protein